ncbi:hypothetical protein [Streptomyces sp. NPDC042319]|uniref:hypothetical protein n=1 Tax=Streptomyces sp. NPDC042319 TaxID=3154332 RepID=UPI0033F488EF
MTDLRTDEQRPTTSDAPEAYSAPRLIELDVVSRVTLGKYAEDSADQGRYFE